MWRHSSYGKLSCVTFLHIVTNVSVVTFLTYSSCQAAMQSKVGGNFRCVCRQMPYDYVIE